MRSFPVPYEDEKGAVSEDAWLSAQVTLGSLSMSLASAVNVLGRVSTQISEFVTEMSNDAACDAATDDDSDFKSAYCEVDDASLMIEDSIFDLEHAKEKIENACKLLRVNLETKP